MSSNTKSEFSTSICLEKPSAENPFTAEARSIKGYDSQDLWQNSTYIDTLILHFTNDLPCAEHSKALETLFIGLMTQGPREIENRSAMIAGITKTRPEHLLNIGLLAGQHLALETKLAQEFIQKNVSHSPEECFAQCKASPYTEHQLAPGFGSIYGTMDLPLQKLADDLFCILPNNATTLWCKTFTKILHSQNQGWLTPGLTAMVCLNLGISAANATGIYQLAKSASIVAYAMEQSQSPMHHAPFLSDKDYEHNQ